MTCTSATQIHDLNDLADIAAQFPHRKAGRMAFLADKEELKPGLVIFRRLDVAHRSWYCRVKLPHSDRYKAISFAPSSVLLGCRQMVTPKSVSWRGSAENCHKTLHMLAQKLAKNSCLRWRLSVGVIAWLISTDLEHTHIRLKSDSKAI